jgi:hypothetical protein
VNEVNMPGFTAEVSLSQANERYQMIGNVVAPADGREILPQLWIYI